MQCNRAHGQFVGVSRIASNADGPFAFFNVHPNDKYLVYTTMGVRRVLTASAFRSTYPWVLTARPGVDDRTLSPAVHRISGRVILTERRPVPKNTRLLLGRKRHGTRNKPCSLPTARSPSPEFPRRP